MGAQNKDFDRPVLVLTRRRTYQMFRFVSGLGLYRVRTEFDGRRAKFEEQSEILQPIGIFADVIIYNFCP